MKNFRNPEVVQFKQMSSEPDDQVCDARDDDRYSGDDKIKKFDINLVELQ
jgi:3-mercaptopyruvate sulfurtransferase SseA